MSEVYILTIDRTWTTQDGVVTAMCVTKLKSPAYVTLPRELPAGSRILAERVSNAWRFVEVAPSGAGP